ncbi:hypothetical protein CDAR_487531 [Caerostris darwini]|uniref:Uncharacterized protein n=1 Tax=Caerostris darwini TaxID=1538125 RepID=A0AAV4PV06_9ARAC|nr:hypothetical protein CDAR_487531 [Caerostris darwini]
MQDASRRDFPDYILENFHFLAQFGGPALDSKVHTGGMAIKTLVTQIYRSLSWNGGSLLLLGHFLPASVSFDASIVRDRFDALVISTACAQMEGRVLKELFGSPQFRIAVTCIYASCSEARWLERSTSFRSLSVKYS